MPSAHQMTVLKADVRSYLRMVSEKHRLRVRTSGRAQEASSYGGIVPHRLTCGRRYVSLDLIECPLYCMGIHNHEQAHDAGVGDQLRRVVATEPIGPPFAVNPTGEASAPTPEFRRQLD